MPDQKRILFLGGPRTPPEAMIEALLGRLIECKPDEYHD